MNLMIYFITLLVFYIFYCHFLSTIIGYLSVIKDLQRSKNTDFENIAVSSTKKKHHLGLFG